MVESCPSTGKSSESGRAAFVAITTEQVSEATTPSTDKIFSYVAGSLCVTIGSCLI